MMQMRRSVGPALKVRNKEVINMHFKDYLREFALAVAGGCCIGIGGIIYMMCSTPLLGAFLFAVGLCTILMM